MDDVARRRPRDRAESTPGRIDDSRDWAWLADHELLLLDDAHLPEALARFSPAGMRAALARSRELLSVPSREVTALVREDPLGLHELLQRQSGDHSVRSPVRSVAGRLRHGGWPPAAVDRPAGAAAV